LSNVVGIAAGARHSLAAKSDGTVVAWGANETNQATVPPGLSNVIAVAANGAFDNDAQFSVALKSDGTVAVWGYDSPVFGLQNGAAAVTNAVAIAVSGAHIVVLKADGTLFGWGDNTVNQAIPPMNGVTPCIFDVTFQAISHRTDRTDHELC
jgi:WD40 repeat protein